MKQLRNSQKKTFEDYKTVQDKVRFLLENNPETVESDKMLVSVYWLNEIKNTINSLSGFDVLMMIGNSKLTSAGTIIRKRQELQNKNEILRGVNYGNKKKKIVNYFKIKKIEQ